MSINVKKQKAADRMDTTEATNAAATVTWADITEQSHYVTHVSGSFSAAATAKMTLKDGTTVVQTWFVTNAGIIADYSAPLKINGAMELSLAAGGAGIIGAVNVSGYSL